MNFSAADLNMLWSGLVVEELLRNGIDTFVVCPGSRSSPLALAIAEEPRAKAFVHPDERGAAFFALGHVAATGVPAVILCTSGSAVANFLPAVIECSKKKLPLIVLTADRPPELRRTGADQTIEQTGIFKEFVRFECELPCPTADIAPAMVLTTVDQAVYRARHPFSGPVHVNVMFREPLLTAEKGDDLTVYMAGLERWQGGVTPYSAYYAPASTVAPEAVHQAAGYLNKARNGIILAGKLNSGKDRASVLALAQKLQWPVVADVTSGLRLSPSRGPVIHYADQLLLSRSLAETLKVDAVLQVGGRMTSRRVNDFVRARCPAHYVMVLDHPLRNDPTHQVTLRVQAKAGAFCQALTPLISVRPPSAQLALLMDLSKQAGRRVEKLSGLALNEPSLARAISQEIPAGHGLFLGNSMPVRDMDMYGAPQAKDIVIGANRGASGIDGTMATAFGFTAGGARPVTLLVGDLAALHDLNSLLLLASVRQPVTIVLVNNDGGGIFSFLPTSPFKGHFERFLGTPHGLHFDAAARMFKIAYARPKTLEQFIRVYRKAVQGRGHTLIEVVTDRNENVTLHNEWQDELRALIDRTLNKG